MKCRLFPITGYKRIIISFPDFRIFECMANQFLSSFLCKFSFVLREDYLHMPYIRFCNNHRYHTSKTLVLSHLKKCLRYNRNRVWQKFQESPRGGVSTLLASYTEPPHLWNTEAWQAVIQYYHEITDILR